MLISALDLTRRQVLATTLLSPAAAFARQIPSGARFISIREIEIDEV